MSCSLDILVVEDNPLNRRLTRDVLVHRGHCVREAETFDEGLKKLGEPPADIVLLDIQLPDGDGKALLSEIRNRPRWSDVPVIAVTAFAMRGDKEKLLESGFDGYISKPIDIVGFGSYIESFYSVL